MKELIGKNMIISLGVTMFFLNLTIYLPNVYIFPYPAYLLDLSIFMLFAAYYIKNNIRIPYQNIVIIWIVYYAIVNFSYFIASPAGPEEYKFLKTFFFFLFLLFSLILLFNLDDENLSRTRKTLVYLAPIATLTLGIDYFDPGVFYFGIDIKTFVVGRAASMYLNSNIAGGAMLLMLILGIDMVPKKWRMLFVAIIFIGVFFTMSRSNLMMFFLILIMMFFQKKLNGVHILISFIGIMFFFTWLATGGLDTLSQKFDLEVTDNMKNRVNFFADNKVSDTGDIQERKRVLMAALEMFADKPILGQGFAATRMWDYHVAPHNTFAMHWADYGLFGVLIIPLMFFFSTYYIFKYGSKEHRQVALLVIPYFTLACLFSHTIMIQPFQLATIIALSTIGYKAKKRHMKKGVIC